MKRDKKPNFFILGAPKCGTTAMADWLSQHPNVFMCDPKEPHFFNTDSNHHGASSLEHYESFFESVSDKHKMVGEASVWYLMSSDAVQNILEYQPDARFIVFVRNPMEMAPSLHDQRKFSGDEDINDFETAWSVQERRKSLDKSIPKTCTDVRYLLYGECCKLGFMLERLYSRVPKDKVHVVVMDDIKTSVRNEYLKVLNFLEIEDDGRIDFPIVNPGKERKLNWPRKLLRHIHLVKGRLNIKAGTGIGGLINRWNIKERQRSSVSDDIQYQMMDYFKEDVALLGKLLQRDLNHWLEPIEKND